MQRALDQADYWAEHAMAALGAMRAHARTEDAKAVLEWIASNRKTELSLRDVHRGLHRRFETALEAQAALSFLDDHGYVRRLPDEPGRRGPKPVRFEVHPKAVTR